MDVDFLISVLNVAAIALEEHRRRWDNGPRFESKLGDLVRKTGRVWDRAR